MSFKSGSRWAPCDVYGYQFRSEKLRLRWDNLMVCDKDWETRHPQDFVRSVKEGTIPWSRPEPNDVFVTVNYVGNGYVEQDYFSPNPDPVEGLYWL